MMVIKSQKVGYLKRAYVFQQQPHFVISPLLFFHLQSGELLLEHRQWPQVMKSLEPLQILDMGMPKPHSEVLLAGAAFAPKGQPVRHMEVSLQVGPLKKRLSVTGDRQLIRGLVPSFRITPPEPFVRMPLTYTRAFGGPGYAHNPTGKGYEPRMSLNKDSEVPLPNIETPGKRIKRPGQREMPAGFGPLDLGWPHRQKKAGTYNDRWLKHDFPGYPKDVDWSIHNAAADDQQHPGFWKGGEPYCLTGMHPDFPVIEGHLPAWTTRVFVEVEQKAGLHFQEIPTHPETVWFFPEHSMGVLIHRGQIPIQDSDGLDVKTLLMAYEHPSQPREPDHYRDVIETRRDTKSRMAHFFNETPLSPVKSDAQREQEQAEQTAAEQRALAEQQRHIDFHLAEMTQASGGTFPQLEKPTPQPNPLGVIAPEAIERGDFSLAPLLEKGDQLYQEAEAQWAKLEADTAAQVSEVPRLSPEEQQQQQALQRAARRQALHHRIMEQPEALHPDHQEAFQDAFFSELQRFQSATKRTEEATNQLFAHQQIWGESQARQGRLYATTVTVNSAEHQPDEGEWIAQWVKELCQRGESLAGRDLAGANLQGQDFRGMDLRGVLLEQADLSGCNFSEANLENATLTGARLDQARFHRANLRNANLCHVQAEQVQWQECDFREARLIEAKCLRCDFSGSRWVRTQALNAELIECRLEGCQVENSFFIEAQAKRSSWNRSQLLKSIFVEAGLQEAQFQESQLQRCLLVNAQAEGSDFRKAHFDTVQSTSKACFRKARFDGAVGKVCGWRQVDLEGASFQGAVMASSDFGESRLHGANLRDGVFYRSIFVKAQLHGADLQKADMLEAVLHKADFSDANLEQANLHNANVHEACFHKATVRGATIPSHPTLNREPR